MAWGHYQGIARQYPTRNLGIINFDTHFDMRPVLEHQQGSSGTPFLQIATAHQAATRRFDYNCIGIQPQCNTRSLFKTAEHYQAKILQADELHTHPLELSEKFIDRVATDNDYIYLS